jgi:hypothetical protein
MENSLTKTIPNDLQAQIIDVVELQKQLKLMEDEVKSRLLDYMTANDIATIKTEDMTVSLSSRTTYKADVVPDDFAKTVLDTTKVSAHEKLYGELPFGIDKNITKYVSWRIK